MSKISKKYLGPDQVDGSILKLEKDQAIRIKKQDGSEVQLISLDIDDNPMMLGSRLTKKSEHESLQGELNTEKGKISSLQSEMSQAQSDISSEVSRAEGQELSIRSEFAAADDAKLLEAKNHAISQDALKLSEAKEYAELKVAEVKSEIMGGLPDATLNTISEIASAIASEQTATGAILTQLGELDSSKASKVELLSGVSEAKSYTDSMIATIPEVDLSVIENRVSNVESDVVAIESYSKNIVHVDAVNGVDEIGRGSLLRPFKTINFAYSQVPSLGNPSNTSYNANVGKFVTEKLIIELAPGRYTENVVLGFKRARVQLKGEGATIIGDVKTSVKLADFPCAALENMKASFPAPFTGVSAFMNMEISGKGGGGLESDPTSSVFVITGQASLAFEEPTMAGFGTGLNWDGSHGQFYAYLDSVSVGNWVVTSSYTANMTRALPGGVVEVDSCNIASSSSTYRMFFGAVPYSYLTDFATWNVASKGTANLAPNSGLTLKAHNSTFGNVIGPALTLGEIDGCRIYDIDRTMRGTVSNGSIIGSTSTSYLGFINNQFRIFSGSGDLASAYKLGQAVGATRYKMDSVSHTTLSFNRNSSGVLSARVLDLGAGVSFDFLDDARSISVADPATNYTRSASTVDASIEGIDNALALKANQSALIAGDASSLAESKAYTDTKVAAIPSVDLSGYYNKSEVDSKDLVLQSNINVEKERVDAILLASEADKDSFAEIVQLINSVDTTNDQAFAGYVLSNNSAVGAVSSDLAAYILQNDINLNTTNEQIQINAENAGAVQEGLQTNIEAEMVRAMGVEQGLEDSKLSKSGGVMTGDLNVESSAIAVNTGEMVVRVANGSVQASQTNESFSGYAEMWAASLEMVSSTSVATATSALVASPGPVLTSDKTTLADNVTSSLSIDTVAASFTRTDALGEIRKISLDTVSGTISAFSDLGDGPQAIMPTIDHELAPKKYVDQASLQAENNAKSYADAQIQAIVDGPSFGRFNAIVGAATSEFMLDKSVKAIMSCSNGRIALHEGFDFTVSVDSVSGFSKLTFIGPSAMGGVSEIESTDQIFVVYAF